MRDERRIDSVYESGQVIDQFATHERVGTVYFGGSRGLRDGWATRWTTGVSVDQRWATALPNAPPGSPLPKDRDLGKVAKGFEPDHRQTLLVSGGAAGRVEQGQLSDTVFSAAARYYWRHTSRRSLYVGLSADHGIRLDIDSQLTLGGDNGLRGYPYRFQTGQSRWLFTAKERWFTDWYPFRLFHVGGAVFYDMGRLGRQLCRDTHLGLGRGLEGRAAGCRRRTAPRHQPIVRRHCVAHRPRIPDRPGSVDAQGAGQRRAETQLLVGQRASGDSPARH